MKDIIEKTRAEKVAPGDWQIQFLCKSNKLRSRLLDVAICLFAVIFLSVLIIVRRPVLADSLLFIVVIVFFGWVGWVYFPWKPADIEKKGDELVLTIWFVGMGISERYSRVTLGKQKSWSFSAKTKTLTFKPSHGQLFSLNGMAQKDLDFVLDWLGRNFKRVPANEDD